MTNRKRLSIITALNRAVRPGCLIALLHVCCLSGFLCAQDWKSGQGSPVHDSDRLYPIGAQSVVLESDHLSLTFDESTGALIGFVNKVTGWHWQTTTALGESFNLFVPTADRSYNRVLGVRNRPASFEKSADGQSPLTARKLLTLKYACLQKMVMFGSNKQRREPCD